MIRRRLAGMVVTALLSPACFGGCTIEPGADCAGEDLTEERLSGANLNGVNFSRANLSGVDLSGADLDNANLSGADLSGSTLTGTHLFMANLSEANLSEAFAGDADFASADLHGADLSGANLVGAQLVAANLAGASLSGANMREANGSEAKIPRSNLSDANMEDAEFDRADLSMADLSGATLSGASLFGAVLSDANLTGASLRGTNLVEARLGGATLEDADLGGADLEGAVGLTDETLADALNVDLTDLARALSDSQVRLESLDSMASELRLACTGRKPAGAGTTRSVGFHPVLDVLARVRATPFADRLPEQFYPPALRFAQLVLCIETDPPLDLGAECGPYTDPQFPAGSGYDLPVKRERLSARIVDASTGREIARRSFLGSEEMDCPGAVSTFDVFVLNEVRADDLKAFVRPFVFAD